MAIIKLFLLIVNVVAQLHTFTPPSVRPSAEQLREQNRSEALLPWMLVISHILIWPWVILEASILVAPSGYCPPAIAHALLYLLPASLTSSDLLALTTPTPAFIIGTALVLAAALLRAHCFRTLGQHFTFELSIRPAHQLITHGVYSIVRHPSYTGLFTLTVGWLLCVFDPSGVVVTIFAAAFGVGSSETRYDNERGAMLTAVLACTWAVILWRKYVGICQRIDREDTMLQKKFGEAWQAWASRVPYRLIPGVY